jgi:hypothetical protein
MADILHAGLIGDQAVMEMQDNSSTNGDAEIVPLFRAVLGPRWLDLPAAVRRLHMVTGRHSFSGLAKVRRGSSAMARIAQVIFGFPDAGDDVPLVITKIRTRKGEIWERNFNGRVFRFYLSPSNRPGHYRERFYIFTYEQELPVIDSTMHLSVRRGWIFGFIPIPGRLLPGSDSREFEVDGRFHFDVGLMAPWHGGLIVRYSGTVTPDQVPVFVKDQPASAFQSDMSAPSV